ncbi:hypothetical protein H2203_002202 [Taxawa tesnikishii (nom. ined.)]|nr:hypothetical protein H2203_002202 [Dothideales sp. JES 119]
MSGLDLAAGIIGCVTITLQSAKVVYTTISELRDAPKTVEDLGSSVQRLYSVLEVILSHPKFVGREDTLAAIDAAFENAHTLHRVALCGLGGVGKSQIAIEYAHRRRERTKESVFWIYASSLARFTEGLEALAERLELPGWNEPKIDKLSLVSKWLSKEESGDWLLILDNIDDVSLVLGSQTGGASSNTSTFVIPQYLPQRGTILITSRSELAAANLVYDNEDCLIKVKPMSAELCKTLLKSKVGSKKLFDADADDQIIELVQELDCIPLAVTQAAAYLSRSRTTVAEYLLDFRSGENEQTALLSTVWNDLRRDQDAAGDSGMNMNAIIKTWQTSFNQIRARHGENDDDTLTSLAELGVVACDAGHLKDGVARQERAYHGLVGKYGPDARIVHECAHNLAWNYTDVGRHEDAETLAWRAVEWCRSHLGLADPFTTQTVRTLSTVYEKQHRSQDAEKLVKEALEAVQDQESRCTLKLTLANSYSFQERNEEACELFNEVLNHRKQTLGPQHPKSLQTAAHLAVAYWHDGRFGEAEQLEVELLRIQVQAFGPDDRFTLNTMYGLALTYHSQGRLQEAVNLLTEAVTLEQKTGREPANEYCALLHEWQHELDSSEDLISDKSCQ